MLLLIWIRILLAETPALATRDANEVFTVTRAFCAGDELTHAAVRLIHLPALAEHLHAVLILKLDGEMIVDVSVVGMIRSRLSSTERQCSRGRLPDHPTHDVEIMEMLLDDVI